MSSQRSLFAAALAAAILLHSCSGGGSATPRPPTPACADPQPNTMCLTSCSLGCGTEGCQITEIAQNQPLVFTFNQPVDPASVTSASVSIRAADGAPAVGQLRVIGERVEFVPELQVVGGVGFFGFRPSQTYVLTLVGGTDSGSAIRAVSGDPLQRSVTCTLSASLGVVDLNGAPPTAELITPRVVGAAPTDTLVQLEFSEAIDGTPFAGSSTENGPIRVSAQRAAEGAGGQLECSALGRFQPLSGRQQLSFDLARGVASWAFVPATPLPTGSCVRIEVTGNVRDLAGIAAPPQRFEFLTAPSGGPPQDTVETFDDDRMLDRDRSSGVWANGRAVFGSLGGRGIHGAFDARDGVALGGDVYEWSTDDQPIRAADGGPTRVRGGRFEFTEFLLPAGETLRFVGSNPVVIRAAGRIEIYGTIELSGSSTTGGIPVGGLRPDPDGAAGGPGAGAGGDGAVAGNGVSHVAANDGGDGADLAVGSAHAFAAAAAGTGGRGSRQFPLDGRTASLVPGPLNFVHQISAGGGGGGFAMPGSNGRAVRTSTSPNAAWLGPLAPGGVGFDVTAGTLAKPSTSTSLEHFLVGGSGGGGGGSHATFSILGPNPTIRWHRGDGGAGGGGALALRAGAGLTVDANAVIRARGGNASRYLGQLFNPVPAPGGAGSGGSILLQCGGGDAVIDGSLDVSGGAGGQLESLGLLSTLIRGGDGSPGIVRLERPGAAGGDPTQLLAGAVPPSSASLGDLEDRDETTSFLSGWYYTGQQVGPTFLYYVIEARVDGVSVTYSDDPAVSTVLALPGQAPIHAQFQGIDLDPATRTPTSEADRPFRDYVGRRAQTGAPSLTDDATNGFRFRITIDRSQGLDVEIDEVRIVYRN